MLTSHSPRACRRTPRKRVSPTAWFICWHCERGYPVHLAVSANSHADASGTYTADDVTIRTAPVLLTVQPIQTTWRVVPTTIQDVYDIKLHLTYQTEAPVPVPFVSPPFLEFARDPVNLTCPMVLNTGGLPVGQFTVYNPSRINITNLILDASKVQGASVTLSYNGTSGSSVTILVLRPLSTVVVNYQASATCPSKSIVSALNMTGNHVYFKVVPALSLSDNEFTFDGTVGLG